MAPATSSAAAIGTMAAAVARRATALGRSDLLTRAVAATYLFSVGRLQEMVPPLMLLRPALLLMAVSCAYIVLKPGATQGAATLAAWPSRVVLTLAVLTFVGAPFGISLGASGLFLLTWFLPVLLFWGLMVVSIRGARDLSTLIWGFMLGTALLCMNSIFFLNVAASFGSATLRLEGADGAMFDANDLCVVLAMALPLCILQFQTVRSRLAKAACLVLIGAIAQTIALSGSRGGFIGLAVMAIVLLVMAKSISVPRRFAIVCVAAVVLFATAPPGYWEQMATVLAPQDDYNFTSSGGRIAIWKRGIQYMLDYPLFGLGVSNFNMAECTISPLVNPLEATGDPNICAAPHNSYIQAAAELGIPGLVLWVSLVAGAFVAPLRLRRRLPKSWITGDAEERFLYRLTMYLPISAIGFACTAFFVSHAWNDMPYALAAWTAGLLVCVRRKQWRIAKEGIGAGVAARGGMRGYLATSRLAAPAPRSGSER